MPELRKRCLRHGTFACELLSNLSQDPPSFCLPSFFPSSAETLSSTITVVGPVAFSDKHLPEQRQHKFLNLKIEQEKLFFLYEDKNQNCPSLFPYFFRMNFKLTTMLEIHQGNSFFCFRFEGLTLQLLSCTNSWSFAVQSIFKSTWKISATRIPRIRTFSKTLPCRNLKLVFETWHINLQLMPGLLSGGLRSLFNGLQQLQTHNPPPSPNPHPTHKDCFQL